MALLHNALVGESFEDEYPDPDAEYAADIDAVLADVPTGEDSHLEADFEDSISGTMWAGLDD